MAEPLEAAAVKIDLPPARQAIDSTDKTTDRAGSIADGAPIDLISGGNQDGKIPILKSSVK